MLFDIYDFLIDFFSSPGFSRAVFIFKLISISLSMVLITGIIILLRKTNILGSKIKEAKTIWKVPKLPVGKIQKNWQEIKNKLESRNESDCKLAVIEADKLLDDILKKMGYRGTSLGDRLSQLKLSDLSNIDKVWSAHKVRNLIVHDSNYKLSLDETEKVIKIYEETLNNLLAL